jgi:hypothetical protein
MRARSVSTGLQQRDTELSGRISGLSLAQKDNNDNGPAIQKALLDG